MASNPPLRWVLPLMVAITMDSCRIHSMMKNKYIYSELAPWVVRDFADGKVTATIDGYDIFEETLTDHSTRIEAIAKVTDDCIAYAMEHGLYFDRI